MALLNLGSPFGGPRLLVVPVIGIIVLWNIHKGARGVGDPYLLKKHMRALVQIPLKDPKYSPLYNAPT